MTSNKFRWLFAAAAVALGLIVVATARADWPENAFSCKSYRADLVWREWARENCGRRWRHHYSYHKPAPDSDIMAAQERLQALGYDLDIDGFMGPETRDALLRFQLENDLKATGVLDPATRIVLREKKGYGYLSDKGDKHAWFRGPPQICPEQRDGGTTRYCACDPIQVTTGEHIWKDGKSESMKRWKGAVRSTLGELFLGWKHAADKVDICWHSGTGERTVDKHVRCMRQARPCWGILEGTDTDELEIDVPRGKD